MTPSIPSRPLLTPWYRLVGDGDRLLLEHAQVVVVLEGAAVSTLLPALLPLLDGTRTAPDLVERLGVAARPAVDRALETLAGHGLLVEGPAAPGPVRQAAHALAAAHAVAPAVAAERLAKAKIGFVGGAAAAADVARLLHAAGVGATQRVSWRRGASVDIALVAPAADELDGVLAWNALALRQRIPWVLLRPFDGLMTAIGPLVVPGESCCYHCVLLRRGSNVEYGPDLIEIDATPSAAEADPGVDALSTAVAAHLVLRWVVGADTTLPGVMFAVEPRPLPAITRHPVLRVPRCPACSSSERLAARLPWHEAQAA
jgi:bacteriocin biosynthesis cyclodehydratase domain-containing protein